MKIRLAITKDAVEISNLISCLSKKFIAGDCSDNGALKLLSSMQSESILEYMRDGYRYHVGELDGLIVGVVATKNNSHLYHLFVSESEQGNGYSSLLWETAKNACVAAGNKGGFTVNSSLNAQEVYKCWGFKPTQGRRESNGVIDVPMELSIGR